MTGVGIASFPQVGFKTPVLVGKGIGLESHVAYLRHLPLRWSNYTGGGRCRCFVMLLQLQLRGATAREIARYKFKCFAYRKGSFHSGFMGRF